MNIAKNLDLNNERQFASIYTAKITQLRRADQRIVNQAFVARAQVVKLVLELFRRFVVHAGMAVLNFSAAVIQLPLALVSTRVTPRVAFSEARLHGVQAIKLATAVIFGSLLGAVNPSWTVRLCQKLELVQPICEGKYAGLLAALYARIPTSRRILQGTAAASAVVCAAQWLRSTPPPSVIPNSSSPLWPVAAGIGAASLIISCCARYKMSYSKLAPTTPLLKPTKPIAPEPIADAVMLPAIMAVISEINLRCLNLEGIYRVDYDGQNSLKDECFAQLRTGDFESFQIMIIQAANSPKLPYLLKHMVRGLQPPLCSVETLPEFMRQASRQPKDESEKEALVRAQSFLSANNRSQMIAALFNHLNQVATTISNMMGAESLSYMWFPNIVPDSIVGLPTQFKVVENLILSAEPPLASPRNEELSDGRS